MSFAMRPELNKAKLSKFLSNTTTAQKSKINSAEGNIPLKDEIKTQSNANTKTADNINTGVGAVSNLALILDASYVTSSTQIFKYSAEGMTATQLTNSLAKSSLATAKVFTKINVITGVATTGYSYHKVYDAYTDPNKEVDLWDVSDAAVGTAAIGGTALVAFGSANFWNPIGWGIGIGAGSYFILNKF